MKRVLIVDDKLENLYLLRALLQGHAFTVDEARHGAEALVKARQSPPDLVISDLLMPVMDGYTLLRHWRVDQRLKTIPFVVYTATYTEPQDERLALEMGADAFILKPTEPEEFITRLRQVLADTQQPKPEQVVIPPGDPGEIMEAYSGVLIRKLEEKALQLQQSNHALQEELAERQHAQAETNRLRHEEERAHRVLLGILEEQKRSEAKLKEQLDELRRWHGVTLGREERVIDLKREVNELLARAGLPPRYGSATGEEGAQEP